LILYFDFQALSSFFLPACCTPDSFNLVPTPHGTPASQTPSAADVLRDIPSMGCQGPHRLRIFWLGHLSYEFAVKFFSIHSELT